MKNSITRRIVSLAARTTLLGMVSLLTGCATPLIPANNVVVDADVVDCSGEVLDNLGPLDVAVAIDTSFSTRTPTGFDIDGNGSIGLMELSEYTDSGDSRLSAQVVALRSLLRNAAAHDIRFSIITYSGRSERAEAERPSMLVSDLAATIRAPLSDDTANLQSVLEEVLADGSLGSPNFYAGMRRANRSLIESEDPARPSRKVVLFISDSPEPFERAVGGIVKEYDGRMQLAAKEALRHKIIFNTFGLSAESESWRRRSLGQIAGATSGTYHVVEDPQRLFCHLASSLAPVMRDSSEAL
jgi:hypothetical protein